MKNKLIKILSIVLVLNIFLVPLSNFAPGNQIKTVHAVESVPELTQTGVVAVTGMIMLMMASNDLIADGITLTASQIGQISSNVQTKLIAADPAGKLITQANNLGSSLKSGADLAAIKALTSGALIYAYLSAVQETLFPKKAFSNNSSYGSLVAISGNIAMYAVCNSSVYGSDHPILVHQISTADYDYYKFQIYNSISRSAASAYKYTFVNTDDWSVFSTLNDTGFYFSNYGFYGIEVWKSSIMAKVLGGKCVYQQSATLIDQSVDVTLPTTMPQTVINNITNYDGISDLVLGIPEGYTVPADNSITVNPGTIVDTPPIDVPVDPPADTTLLGTVAAILAGLTPIAGFLEHILAGQVSLTDAIEAGLTDVVDGIGDIAGTLTGGITSSLTDIQSSISTLTAPATDTINLDPVKNVPKVLFTKFPFSIPWDLFNVYNLMATDNRSPPEFSLGIPMTKSTTLSAFGVGDINMSVKLENYDQIFGIIRVGELLLFVIGLIFATKKLIWG